MALFLLLCAVLATPAVVNADYCSYYDYLGEYQTFRCPGLFDDYDEDNCCGSGSSQYCCDNTVLFGHVNYAAIAGGVITGIVILVIIIVVSICCCVATCPMYRRRRGGMVQTGPSANTVVISGAPPTTQSYPMGQVQPQAMYQPPPAYNTMNSPTQSPTGYPMPSAGYVPPQPNTGYPPMQPTSGYPPSQPNSGYQPAQSNIGYQPDQSTTGYTAPTGPSPSSPPQTHESAFSNDTGFGSSQFNDM